MDSCAQHCWVTCTDVWWCVVVCGVVCGVWHGVVCGVWYGMVQCGMVWKLYLVWGYL